MARKTIKISPEQIKSLRQKASVTQKEAAERAHISLRQWQKFEESENSSTYVRIPDATLELFCLKSGLSFPPIFESSYKHGKTISFAGGPGGIGRSTLTRDMSLLLTNEGFDVLIITDDTGQLVLSERRHIETNTPFPKILAVKDLHRDDHRYGELSFEKIKKNYDFIFFDLEKNQAHLDITKYDIDLVITPVNPMHHFDTSIRNIVHFLQASQESTKTKVASLLVGISESFCFNLYSHGFEEWMTNEQLQEPLSTFEWKRQYQENSLKDLYELKQFGVYIFDTYSSDIYKYYESLHFEENGFGSTGFHFIDKPNTLSAHQMNSIKNELLRLFGISLSQYS
ncbi:hypothetical protein ACSTJT_12995 [Vibrio parahaemolyticus]|uniref:helix-turn-helix domain-containing protein n=1 Tax=Vibrio alginolyticus TaxID=663 RepID=UPI003D7DD922